MKVLKMEVGMLGTNCYIAVNGYRSQSLYQ